MNDHRSTIEKALAAIIQPARCDPIHDLQGFSAEELVAALQRNKVPLLSLDRSIPVFQWFYASDAFGAASREQESQYRQQRARYLTAQSALHGAGVPTVLIKSVGIAPSFPYMSDNVDMLVSLENGSRARSVLWDLGYIELRNVEEPHKFLFRQFDDGISKSAIHVHEFVGWGTGFLSHADVLDASRPAPDDPDIAIPSPEDGLLITLAHAFYEDKEIKLGDLWKVMRLSGSSSLDWDLVRGRARERAWLDGLYVALLLCHRLEAWLYGDSSIPGDVVAEAESRAELYSKTYLDRLQQRNKLPLRVAFRFSKRHYYRKVLDDPTLTAAQRWTDIVKHTWAGIERRLSFRPQTGMLVTLSGIDGSGKTTVAKKLCATLDTCDLANRYVWSRGASSRMTDAVIRVAKPLLPRQDIEDASSTSRGAKVQRKGVWLQRPFLRAGWCALVALDLVAKYWRQVLVPLALGRVVVADRYVYDALVELASLAERTAWPGSLSARLLMAMVPRPRKAYWLRAETSTALARVTDETRGFLDRQGLVFETMARTWGLATVDADETPQRIANTIINDVLSSYYRRPETALGASAMHSSGAADRQGGA